jgi:hypothetical protein
MRIRDVADGKRFWNPNPNAVDRHICRDCYDRWNRMKQLKFSRAVAAMK